MQVTETFASTSKGNKILSCSFVVTFSTSCDVKLNKFLILFHP